MLAKYNNALYGCVKFDETYHLLTTNIAKTDPSFRQSSDGYYNKDVQLSDPLLTDLYETDLFAMYKDVLYKIPLIDFVIPQDKPDSIVLKLNQNKRIYKTASISDLDSVIIRRYYIKSAGKENRKVIIEDKELPVFVIRNKTKEYINI